jgi:hypothetical protein
MPQLPDSIRPFVSAVVKYHFWILAAILPLLLLPALFAASSGFEKVIAAKKSEIDGHFTSLNSVSQESNHPNDRWSEAMTSKIEAVRGELLGEWRLFWESQEPLRVWPAELGGDFLAAIERVERAGGGKDLEYGFRQRYQNTVSELVRQLPARMGCEELMSGETGAGRGEAPRGMARGGFGPGMMPGGMGDDAATSQSLDPLVWDGADQERLIASFIWDSVPSTTQVLLAQEELWVYGLLCDVIGRINEGATGRFDSSIVEVEELAVGYPAAEDQPGGEGTQRIVMRSPAALNPLSGMGDEGMPTMEPGGAGMMGPGAEMEPGAGQQGRPPNPRFLGSSGSGGPGRMGLGRGGPPAGGMPGMLEGEGEGLGPEVSPDEQLKHWIYVDFDGSPLRAEQLGTTPDAQIMHLMPFTLRVVINQRRLDALLAELAAQTVPIDVRQVRVNPSADGGGAAAGGPRRGRGRGGPGRMEGGGVSGSGLSQLPDVAGGSGGGSEMGGEPGRRPFDITVELRGTIGLATRPRDDVFTAAAADGLGGAGGAGGF